MKIHTEKNRTTSSVELSLNCRELKWLADALHGFESKISQYKLDNAEKDNFGVTHLHYRDIN